MRLAPNVDPNQVWRTTHAEIQQMLGEHGVGNVELKRADEEPQQSPGGKYREVIPLQS
jgi:phenylacetate-CoA ligase